MSRRLTFLRHNCFFLIFLQYNKIKAYKQILSLTNTKLNKRVKHNQVKESKGKRSEMNNS